jgi:hypothetical protein
MRLPGTDFPDLPFAPAGPNLVTLFPAMSRESKLQ